MLSHNTMSAVRATITLPEMMKKKVDAELQERDITFSQYVRRLIRDQQNRASCPKKKGGAR